jgi:hypothetical protein
MKIMPAKLLWERKTIVNLCGKKKKRIQQEFYIAKRIRDEDPLGMN